jgi:hypothetical protein
MWKKIDSYSLYWDASNKIGTVYLKLSDQTEGSIKRLSITEMAAYADTLRNEDPVWFHSTRGDVSTEKTPSDEEERT